MIHSPPQVKPVCVETLMLIAERMTLNYTSLQVMKASFDQKNPKVRIGYHDKEREFSFTFTLGPCGVIGMAEGSADIVWVSH